MIEAAGGLLWRRGPRGALEIALVERHRHDDLSLPKGKLTAGESSLAAALREVQEETGYAPTALGFAGAIAYATADGPKLVRFWNMIPRSEARSPVDASEVRELAWLTPAEARARMTYPLERVMVEVWMDEIRW